MNDKISQIKQNIKLIAEKQKNLIQKQRSRQNSVERSFETKSVEVFIKESDRIFGTPKRDTQQNFENDNSEKKHFNDRMLFQKAYKFSPRKILINEQDEQSYATEDKKELKQLISKLRAENEKLKSQLQTMKFEIVEEKEKNQRFQNKIKSLEVEVEKSQKVIQQLKEKQIEEKVEDFSFQQPQKSKNNYDFQFKRENDYKTFSKNFYNQNQNFESPQKQQLTPTRNFNYKGQVKPPLDDISIQKLREQTSKKLLKIQELSKLQKYAKY